MEKISGILKGSHRMSSIDSKPAPPVRPGVPSFGRPIGNSTGLDHERVSTGPRNPTPSVEESPPKKTNDDFFIKIEKTKPQPEAEVGSVEPDVQLPVVAATDPRIESFNLGEDFDVPAPSATTPRGSFIDLRA